MTNQVYLLDANIFIEAARHYYAFDFVPAFWNHLVRLAADGSIASIDRIKKQLEDGNDDLAQWIKDGNLREAFASTEQSDVIETYQKIIQWVQSNTQFTEAAKATFANDADGWLVAYAKAKDCILVTHEVENPEARSRIKIPNICRPFGVIVKNTFDMLRALGIKLG